MSSALATKNDSFSAREAASFSFAQARKHVQDLEDWLIAEEALELRHDEVETEIESQLREAARSMLEGHMKARGLGDVGPVVIGHSQFPLPRPVRKGRPSAPTPGAPDVRHSQRTIHVRKLVSLFGVIEVVRLGYGHSGQRSIHPFDSLASLPIRSFSYELQKRVAKGVAQAAFLESIKNVHEWTSVGVSKRSAEQIAFEAAQDFDEFYKIRSASVTETTEDTAPIVVVGIDCKGVPMLHSEDLRVNHNGKGKKRMATVAAVATVERRIRTPEEVVDSLFDKKPKLMPELSEKQQRSSKSKEVKPKNKRVWASLIQGKEDVIKEAAREVEARDPHMKKDRVILSDGEVAIKLRTVKEIKGATDVLDFMHVTPRLWNIAHCFHLPESQEAKAFVESYALKILQGKIEGVIDEIGQLAKTKTLDLAEREKIDSARKYFSNNKERMRYDEYLRKGLPIASGLVEGTCKHLVKDRLEQSGMRWTLQGAEAVLRLRSVYLSDDFSDYWTFHIQREQERIHLLGRWSREAPASSRGCESPRALDSGLGTNGSSRDLSTTGGEGARSEAIAASC